MKHYHKTVVLVVIAVVVALAVYKNIHKNDAGPRNVDLLSQETGVAIVEKDKVNYYGQAQGFFAQPADAVEKSYPGVVMIHEWWGLNDQIKDMARQLAKQGYQVLAVDLYNGEVASTADRAQQLVGGFKQDDGLANLHAATMYLRDHRAAKIASLGWCFGGGQSLQLAMSGEALAATVLYYGSPLVIDKTKLASIQWPVMGVFGDKDQVIPLDTINQFKQSLADLHIQNDVTVYPGLGHAFANPSGASYAPRETKEAWEKTLMFLKANLQ